MEYKLELKDALKQETTDQDKLISPHDTVKKFQKKLEQLDLNILDKIEKIDNGRLGIPVYFSYYGPYAKKITGLRKQMGKGATEDQAKASAVMELAERFSFFSFHKNSENFIEEKYINIKDKAISFEQIAKSVHDESDDLAKAEQIFETLPLRWAKAYNFTKDEPVLVPFDWFYAINEFNGSCAGNCPEEALCQGICEVVERHVSEIISREKRNVPVINSDSAKDPIVKDMIEKYKKAGINLTVSDFTLDMGIPTVGVLAWDPSTFPEKSEIVWTAGTTPDPQKAMSRALSETAQLAGDFNTGSNYLASGLPKFKNIKDAEFIINGSSKISISDLPDISSINIKEEVENLVQTLDKKNMEVIAVDITNPLIEVPAFYIMIPGARFRERSEKSSVGMFCTKLMAENNHPLVAADFLEKANEILPGKYYIRFYLGTIYLALGDNDSAYEYFKQALELEPSSQDLPSIYSYMGVCLKDMGKYEKALEILEKGNTIDPDRTDIHNLMGFCHFMLKEHEFAIKCFENVIKLDPGSAIDYANIASNYRDLGNKEKAIEYYQMALALDPSIEFARDNLVKLM